MKILFGYRLLEEWSYFLCFCELFFGYEGRIEFLELIGR